MGFGRGFGRGLRFTGFDDLAMLGAPLVGVDEHTTFTVRLESPGDGWGLRGQSRLLFFHRWDLDPVRFCSPPKKMAPAHITKY
jgi:hypothetical protein